MNKLSKPDHFHNLSRRCTAEIAVDSVMLGRLIDLSHTLAEYLIACNDTYRDVGFWVDADWTEILKREVDHRELAEIVVDIIRTVAQINDRNG